MTVDMIPDSALYPKLSLDLPVRGVKRMRYIICTDGPEAHQDTIDSHDPVQHGYIAMMDLTVKMFIGSMMDHQAPGVPYEVKAISGASDAVTIEIDHTSKASPDDLEILKAFGLAIGAHAYWWISQAVEVQMKEAKAYRESMKIKQGHTSH